MTCTSKDATSAFLAERDSVIGWRYKGFRPETPIAEILHPEVLDPECFLLTIQIALSCEIDDIDQNLIFPETDSIESMMTRLSADRATRINAL